MVKQGCFFLNGPPDHILLMWTQFDGFRCSCQFNMGTVIMRRYMGIEPFVIKCRELLASFIIHSDPIQKRLPDFIGLLHGGGCQLLIHNLDGLAVFVFSDLLFHLDGPVGQQ